MSIDRTDPLWQEIYKQGLKLGMDDDSAQEQADDAFEACVESGYGADR